MKMLYDIIAGIISMIAKSLGVSYATANVAWSLYLQGLVCILSCLLLLIPMRKRYKQFGLDVFTISGTVSILGYTYLIFSNWFNFISPFIGLSFQTQHKALINYTKMTGMQWHMSYQSVYLILFVFLGVALIGMNFILLVWFNRLAKKTSNELISFPVSK